MVPIVCTHESGYSNAGLWKARNTVHCLRDRALDQHTRLKSTWRQSSERNELARGPMKLYTTGQRCSRSNRVISVCPSTTAPFYWYNAWLNWPSHVWNRSGLTGSKMGCRTSHKHAECGDNIKCFRRIRFNFLSLSFYLSFPANQRQYINI